MSHRRFPARLMESLESRTLLSFDPMTFPDVNTDLETATNPVVLIETTMGNIYWELLPGDAPGHVANLLEYINDGDYAFSFFHRLVGGFVLQGGEFVWDDDTQTLTTVDENPTVTNEPVRSNVARTVALAKMGGDPNSGRNQFFINLDDNSGTPPNGLDFQNGGFTVFALVAGAPSWSVVQSIASLATTDNFFSLEPTGALGEVPVDPSYNDGDPISESALVRIINISLIKEQGSTEYFAHRLAFPEGFRGDDDIAQFLQVANLENASGTFHVYARYESDRRDRLIATGRVGPDAISQVTLSDFEDLGVDLLRESAPVAFEIRSTTEMAATIVREDFGAVTGESFFNVDALSDADQRSWVLPGMAKGAGVAPFVVWQNMSDQPATVTLFFEMEGGAQVIRQTTTEPYRRGGYNIGELADVPDGEFSILILSDQNVVAAASQFEALTGSPPSDLSLGHVAGGVPGGFALEGMLAGAIRRPGETTFLTVYNSSPSTGAVVRIIAHLDDGSQFQLAPIIVIPAGEHYAMYDISTNTTLPTDEYFTLRFNSPTVPVAAQYTSISDGDSFSTPFQITGGDYSVFALGFTDVADTEQFESISIFNPYSSVSVNYDYGVRFRFVDGTSILGAGGTLAPMNRITVDTIDLIAVTNKIQSDPTMFSTYSIEVFSVVTDGVNSLPGLVVAQYTAGHRGDGDVTTTIGTPYGSPLPLMGPGIGG